MYLFPQLFYKAVLFIHINSVSYIYPIQYVSSCNLQTHFFCWAMSIGMAVNRSLNKIFHNGPELNHHFGLNPLGTQSFHFSKEGGELILLDQTPCICPWLKLCIQNVINKYILDN